MNTAIHLQITSVGDLLKQGCNQLHQAGIEEAREDTECMLMKLLDSARFEIYLKVEEPVSAEQYECFLKWIEQRKGRKPLAQIVQEAGFWQERLFVNEQCLIPRPETEVLIQTVSSIFRDKQKFSFLDIGTGSGAIAIALLRECLNAQGTLLDISEDALDVARKNVKKYSLESRTNLVQGDLFRPFSENEKWDLIVSNPPYLASWDWDKVERELEYEPRLALDGGEDGLDFYRRIIPQAAKHLEPGGLIALEVGWWQAEMVSKWFQEAGYGKIQRFRDYLHIERVVIARNLS